MARKEAHPNAAQIVRWRPLTSFLPRFPERETIYISADLSFVRWAYRDPEGTVERSLRMMIQRSGAHWQSDRGYPIATSKILVELIRLAGEAHWRVADMRELTDLPPMSIDAMRCGIDAYALTLDVDDLRQSRAAHHGQRLAVALHQIARETGYAWIHHPGNHDRLVSSPLSEVEVEALLARLAPLASIKCTWTSIDPAISKPVTFCCDGKLVRAELDFTDPLHLLLVDQQVWKNRNLKWVRSIQQFTFENWEAAASRLRSMGGQLVETCRAQRSSKNIGARSRWRESGSPPDDDLPEVVPPDPRRPTTPMLLAIETSKVVAALDEGRLAAIRAETVNVATLLGDIFVDEENPAPTAAGPPPPSAGGRDGLDAKHSALLATLSTRDEWAPADFGRLVREAGLMPGAARDVLNNWSLDRYDELVLEGGDPVLVNVHLMIEKG